MMSDASLRRTRKVPIKPIASESSRSFLPLFSAARSARRIVGRFFFSNNNLYSSPIFFFPINQKWRAYPFGNNKTFPGFSATSNYPILIDA